MPSMFSFNKLLIKIELMLLLLKEPYFSYNFSINSMIMNDVDKRMPIYTLLD